MTKQQNNKRMMLESVVSLLETNAARTSSIQELAASAARLKNLITEMQQKTVEVEKASIGKAAVKSEVKENLRFALYGVTAGLYAYASKEGKTELQAKARIRFYQIQRMREAELAATGEVILNLAKEAGSALEPHGIPAATVVELENLLADFKAILGEVQSSIATRVANRRSLQEMFAEADVLLTNELDRYFEVLEGSDAEIANAYFAARKIKGFGIRHNAAEPEMIVPQMASVARAA